MERLAYAHSGGKLAFDSTAAVRRHRLINPASWSAEQGRLAFLRKNPGLASGRASCSGVQYVLQTPECSSQKSPYSLRKPMEVSQA